MHAAGRPGQLEVVDVDHEEQLQLAVEVAGRPLRTNWSESDTFDMLVALLFPQRTGVRVSIEGPVQAEDRVP